MIKINVKTLFNGRAGVRDKYLKEAKENFEDLLIEYEGEQMLIPYHDIERKIAGKSKYPVKDKFSPASHYLLYFKFKPEIIQSKLNLD